MKVSWNIDGSGRVGLRSHDLELLDTYPVVSEFWMDASPSKNWADRVAVASTLIYGSHMGGRFHAPFAMSPRAAIAISKFSRWGDIIPTNVSSGAGTLTWGGGLELSVELAGFNRRGRENSIHETRRIALEVLRGDEVTGSLFSFDRLTLASNAWLFSKNRNESERIYPYLAVAVLFAADLQISTIVCPPICGLGVENLARLGDLLSAVGLGLEFESS